MAGMRSSLKTLIILPTDIIPITDLSRLLMGLLQVGASILTSLLIGALTAQLARAHVPSRTYLLLAFSVLAVYWFQPLVPLRSFDFWLPSLTLALVVLTWFITSRLQRRTSMALASKFDRVAADRWVCRRSLIFPAIFCQTLSSRPRRRLASLSFCSLSLLSQLLSH